MAHDTVTLLIPFESLIDSVTALSAQAEEEMWDQDPTTQAEIQEARAAYRSGDYVTIDEYIAQKRKKA
ncbi:MAG: hypothetical protein P8186_32850 [Anaerolineae bacterium]